MAPQKQEGVGDMKRRDFIASAAALAALPRLSFAQQKEFNPAQTEQWRSFEIVTRIEGFGGTTKAWIPVPAVDESWQRTIGNAWTGNATTMRLVHDPKYGAALRRMGRGRERADRRADQPFRDAQSHR
jgi:hypothetical protein